MEPCSNIIISVLENFSPVISGMEIFLGITAFAIALVGMAIGVILNNKPISGSCGGLNPNGACSICGGDPQKCENTEADSISL